MRKHAIIYGQLHSGVQKKAVELLSQFLLDYTHAYPVCLQYEPGADHSAYRCFYIGTKHNNGFIAENADPQLAGTEAYSISVKNDTVIIEGFDDAGVLYGCVDFYNQYIIRSEYAHAEDWHSANYYWRNIFEKPLPDFACSSAPSVRNRGIWTWGHVIYDYRGFIDHMVKLKLNTIIIWNDFAPVNAKEIIEYAHRSAVKVIWGFSWGWDDGCSRLSLRNLNDQSQDIFRKFKEEYGALDVDGIYFQSITELETEYLEGILVADAVTEFVNSTARLFFNTCPDLELQFGLHATSVKNRLEFIKKVDPRIRIVWEDCGSFPFSYFPHTVDGFAETKAFSENIANLRGVGDRFGVVLKGMTKLDWPSFEHLDGPISLGTSSDAVKADRINRKSRDWKYFQAYWMANGNKALEMIRTLAECKQGDLHITALVEDGMFEENIMYPVALYSEMLWNCNADFSKLLSEVALRSYVTFA